MSRICDTCGKERKKAASRSHSKIKSLRVQKVNLQTRDGMRMCTRCIKTEAKQAA